MRAVHAQIICHELRDSARKPAIAMQHLNAWASLDPSLCRLLAVLHLTLPAARQEGYDRWARTLPGKQVPCTNVAPKALECNQPYLLCSAQEGQMPAKISHGAHAQVFAGAPQGSSDGGDDDKSRAQSGQLGHLSSLRTLAKLHAISPTVFPLPPAAQPPADTAAGRLQQPRSMRDRSQGEGGNDILDVGGDGGADILQGGLLSRLRLGGGGGVVVDRTGCPAPVDPGDPLSPCASSLIHVPCNFPNPRRMYRRAQG